MNARAYGLLPRGSLAPLLCAALLLLAGQWAVTQWLASLFAYQPALGGPWFHVGELPVYAPLGWLRWLPAVPEAHAQRVHSAVLLSLALPLLIPALLRLRWRDRDQHGSARWARRADIVRAGLLGAVRRGGVYVGAFRGAFGRPRYLRHDGPEHVLAFAPTRSGKGVGLVIPTLLSWRDSAVVLDIKGENWARTAGWRHKVAGQRVLLFDPSDEKTVRFNPLAEIRLGTAHEIADAQNIASILVDPQGKGIEGNHWAQTAWSLLVGAILHVCHREQCQGRQGSLALVAEELSSGAEGYQEIMERWLHFDHGHEPGAGTHPAVAAATREMLQRAAREASSVLSSALAYLSLYRDPLVARATSQSDFGVMDLVDPDTPTTLYLLVRPSDLQRMRPLLRLMLTQIVQGLTAELPARNKPRRSLAKRLLIHLGLTARPSETGRRRVLLMLDELAALGKLEVLEQALAHCAGYGLKAFLIVQDLSQLYDAYGRDESIVGNCHIRIAYAPNKIETAELLSKMTGTTTVRSRIGTGRGRHRSHHARALLTPDECMRLRLMEAAGRGRKVPGDALILVAGHPPIYGEQILYFEDSVLQARAEIPAPASHDAWPTRPLSPEALKLAEALARSASEA